MEYKKILTTLRRYSFSEKMRIANKYSRQIMSPKGLLEPDSLAGRPLPWDIETFVIFAVVAKEWQNNNFIGKNEKVFIEIINSILEYCPPTLEKCKESFLFTDFYLVLAGSVQYDIQEYYPYKLYRHNFYFSFVNEKVNMPALFFKKFGCDYKDFMVFSTFLWCAYTSGANISQSIYDYWLSKYNICSNALSISRENFIKQVEKFSETPDDYRYCLRPSYSFPFVVEGNLTYLPLPHLLMRAVTSSLMFRITEKDNDLANLIGKEVLEPYLFKIINESNLFDEVLREQEIPRKGGVLRTPDVMARKDDVYVFFDSKYFAPRTDLRTMVPEAFEETIDRLSDHVIQVYKHIHNYFPMTYNCFKSKGPVSKDKVYGLVVVRDDPHIRPQSIYNKSAQKLKLSREDTKYKWLCGHVGIVSINEIERYCFTQSDFINAICRNNEEEHCYDYWLCGSLNSSSIKGSPVYDFIRSLNASVLSEAHKMRDLGILK